MLENPLYVKLYVDRNAQLHCCKSNKVEVKIKAKRSILTHFKCFLIQRVDLFGKNEVTHNALGLQAVEDLNCLQPMKNRALYTKYPA